MRKRSEAAVAAMSVGVCRRAMAYRMKRWPKEKWLNPPAPNSMLMAKGRKPGEGN